MRNNSFCVPETKGYDCVWEKDVSAYRQMFEQIRPVVKGKAVLELETGTGFIARNVLHDAALVEATDSSPAVIEEAQKSCYSSKLHFSVQDVCALPYGKESFPVIIAANVLDESVHPEKALGEIRRVLSLDGTLIIPAFAYGNSGFMARRRMRNLSRFGVSLRQRWSSEEYLAFLKQNGWKIEKSMVLMGHFPVTYVECSKETSR